MKFGRRTNCIIMTVQRKLLCIVSSHLLIILDTHQFLRQLNISINFCFVYLYCSAKFFSKYLMPFQILWRNVILVHSIFLSRSFCYGTILLLTANWQLFFILTFWMSALMIFRPSYIIASFNVFWYRINVTKNRNYLTFKSVLTPQRIEYH